MSRREIAKILLSTCTDQELLDMLQEEHWSIAARNCIQEELEGRKESEE